jgi:hypothetical protein
VKPNLRDIYCYPVAMKLPGTLPEGLYPATSASPGGPISLAGHTPPSLADFIKTLLDEHRRYLRLTRRELGIEPQPYYEPSYVWQPVR